MEAMGQWCREGWCGAAPPAAVAFDKAWHTCHARPHPATVPHRHKAIASSPVLLLLLLPPVSCRTPPPPAKKPYEYKYEAEKPEKEYDEESYGKDSYGKDYDRYNYGPKYVMTGSAFCLKTVLQQ